MIVDVAEETNQRRDEVFDGGRNDGTECYANNDANCQVHHVSPQDKISEISQSAYSLLLLTILVLV